MLCSPLILLFPSIDLRFFTANAFFNILSTPTKSTSTLFASFIWRLASRSTACCVLSSATLLQGKLRHATCAKIPTERFWKLTNVAIELLAQQPPPDSALASSKIQHNRICFLSKRLTIEHFGHKILPSYVSYPARSTQSFRTKKQGHPLQDASCL